LAAVERPLSCRRASWPPRRSSRPAAAPRRCACPQVSDSWPRREVGSGCPHGRRFGPAFRSCRSVRQRGATDPRGWRRRQGLDRRAEARPRRRRPRLRAVPAG
jgi:hypothetical protein